jgi:replicative DNA helicase
MTTPNVRTYQELLADYQQERGSIDYEPVHLGFGSLDADIRGISAGQVLGIAARTAVGKTFLLGTISHNFSARRDAGSVTLSLEMPGVEWAERALAIATGLAPEQIEGLARDGNLASEARGFLTQMDNARVVDDAVSLKDLAAVIQATREALTVPLRLVLIDYLGLIDVNARDAYERASAIGKGLKAVAKAERIAIIVAVQVSRAGGDGSEPVSLAMLRDSGVIEEALDFLLGAWRPGKAPNLSPPDALNLRDVLRVAVLKNRKGLDGRVVDLRFEPDSRRLYEDADPFAELV